MISFGEDKENGSREILENAGRGIPESTSCELSQSTGCRIPQNASYEIPQSTSCGLSIIDFGIARTFKNDAEQDTHHFGTRAYAPPEQFGFGQTDVRTDIYALGMILFFLLTGENPSANDRKNNFEKLRAFDNLRSVVVRATELDPKKRFSNVRELKQAFLQGIQESAPASAKNFAGSENLAGTSSFASTGRLTNANDFAGNLTAANNPSPETMPNPGFSPQEHSHAPHKETHGRQPHSAIGRFLSKIPEFPGVVWDILLLFFFGICCIGAVQNIIYPKNSTSVAASLPLPGRILAYGSVVLLVCGPVFFAICDRRPLLRAFPKLKKISLGRDFLTCFIVLIVGIFLVALSSNITY